MDEEKVLEQSEGNEVIIDIESVDPKVEQRETIEYVEVELPEEVVIEFEESFGVSSSPEGITHFALPDRNDPNQHKIVAIEGLEDILDKLSSNRDVYSVHGGYAEFIPWLKQGYYNTDDTYEGTGGVGYFVSLVKGEGNIDGNNTYIDICRKKNDDGTVETLDVYGVTVANSGVYGYQDKTYDLLDLNSPNRADNPLYAKVCLLGNVKVRISSEEYKKVQIGDYVVSNELGYAKKSENNVGFKVISKGQIESVGGTTTAWYYVEIALVPQNDNIARVMKKIEDTQVNLEGISIQLDNMSGELEGMKDSNIQLGTDFKGLKDLVNESNNKVDTLLPEMERKLQEAVDKVVNEADKAINDMTLEYTESVSKADEALKQSSNAISTVSGIRDDLEPLAQWQDKGSLKEAIAGFVAQADADHVELSTLTERVGDHSTDIIAVTQKIDDNGASIQQLVARADRYSLGPHSLSYKLTYDEAIGILKLGHIYVPTEDHKDEMSYIQEGAEPINFELGKSYIWKIGDTPDVYTWVENGNVSTATEYIAGTNDGDLWYCWQGVLDGDTYIYNPETLYRWDGSLWISVATVDGNIQARSLGLLKQTADELTVTYTNLDDKVSTMKMDMDSISTTVSDVEKGLTQINQTAEKITLGTYKPEEGATSLGILLNGMQSISNYGGRIRIKHVTVDSLSVTEKRYTQAPMWNGEEFVFAEANLNNDGEYYPYSELKDGKLQYDNTKYCKIVGDGYEVYTIGNEATALLRTDVDKNKSAIDALAQFDTDTSGTLATIQAQADANSAQIASVAAGEYVVCSNINLEPTDDDKAKIPLDKYKNPPTWGDNGFAFDENDKDSNGIYCMFANDAKHYYKLLFNIENQIVGYEQYELASSGSASIMQMVTKNGSSIGMIVKNDEVDASVIVEAINDAESTVKIEADKIHIDGLVSFTNGKNLNDWATSIDQSAISKVEVQYALSDSNTDAPTTGWSSISPTWTSGKYIWQRTFTTYANGKTSTSAATCIQGAVGEAGVPGRGIQSIRTFYCITDQDSCAVPEAHQLNAAVDYSAEIQNVVVMYAQSATLNIPIVWKHDEYDLDPFNAGDYLWTRTIIDYADDSYDAVVYTYSKIGEDGGVCEAGRYDISFTVMSIEYQRGDSDNEPPNGNWCKNISDVSEGSYLWTRAYLDGWGYAYGIIRLTVSNEQFTNMWFTTSPPIDKTNRYLWSCEMITYTDGTFDVWSPTLSDVYSEPSRSTTGVTNYYYATANDTDSLPSTEGLGDTGDTGDDEVTGDTSDEVISDASWCKSVSDLANPFSETYKYLWNCEVVSYSDGTSDITEPTIIGVYSKDGKGIQEIAEYYMTTETSEVPDTNDLGKWIKGGSSIVLPQTSATQPYLWNYEVIDYTDGESSTSGPALIGTYGNSIKSTTEYYAATATNAAPSRYSSGTNINTDVWKEYLVQINQSPRTPYVWNFERVEYTIGDPKDTEVTLLTSSPRVIATITEYYVVKTDNATPDSLEYVDDNHNIMPSIPDEWQTTRPSVSQGDSLWNCEVIKYTAVDSNGQNLYEIVPAARIGYAGTDGTGVDMRGTAYVNNTIDDSSIAEEYELYHDQNYENKITDVNYGDSYLVNGYLFVYSGSEYYFTCVGKIQGPQGLQGQPGRGVSSVSNYYMASARSSGVEAGVDGTGAYENETWTTDIQTLSETKPYLWNYETIFYTTKNTEGKLESTSTAPAIIGKYSKDGRGILSIEEFYCISSKTTCNMPTDDTLNRAQNYTNTANPDSWYKNSPPTDSTNKYLWNCERVNYTDDTKEIFTPALIGIHGDPGVGISQVIEWYALSNDKDKAPADNDNINTNWETELTPPTKDKPYLWNYEETKYTDNRASVKTTKVIIAMYTEDGRSIDKVRNYYLKSDKQTGITKDNMNGYQWLAIPPLTTNTQPYLWNYEQIIYDSGEYDITAPCVIGVHGDKGDPGVSLQVKYINSESTPTITNNDITGWSDTIPTVESGKRTYMTQKMSNETNWSTPVQISAEDGVTPTVAIDETTKNWIINGESTSIKAQGEDGDTPEITIGANGNWYVNGTDTGTQAQGEQGVDGNMIEYVYYRSTAAQSNLSAPSYTDDELTSGWTASPQGITDTYKYEYMSLRTKTDGTWSAFSTPVIWSKWGEKGQDGDGISYKYYLSNSATAPAYDADSTQWTDEPSGVSETNQYEYVVQIKLTTTNGQTTSTPSSVALWAKWGEKGADGVSINSVTVAYAKSNTLDIPQDNEEYAVWKSTIEELGVVGEEEYLWTRTIIDYTDNEIDDTVTYTYSKQAKNGNHGTSVTVTSIQYQEGNSATDTPDGTWSDDIVEVAEGKYLWTKTTFSDGEVAYGVAKQGVSGKDGTDGKTPVKGVDYFDGTDGKDGTSIVWKGTYNSAPNDPQNGWAYYNSTDKASYVYQDSWYQMSIDGVDGQNGADGASIVWKGELSEAPTSPQKNWVYRDKDDGKIYIYNGTGWELMVLDGNDGTDGTDGSNGLSVFITYNDSTETPSAPTNDGTADGWHTNATSAAIWMSQKVAVDASSGTWGAPIKIKGTDGKTPVKGVDYFDGTDGISIKSITVTYGTSDSASTTPTTWTSDIPVVPEDKYLWTRTVTDYTDNSMQDTVTYTYTKQGKTGTAGTSVTVKTVQYQACESATQAPTGTWSDSVVTVPEGQYLWTKTTFSDNKVAYGVAKQGQKGDKGDAGRGIVKVVPQYYLSTSNTECKDGTWQYDQPEWKKDHYIWTRSETTYDTLDENGENIIEYTEPPTLAGAHNSANQTANDAKDTAEEAKDKATAANNLLDLWKLAVENDTTYINGSLIATKTVAAEEVFTNTLCSTNYTPVNGSIFSQAGTSFNLADGSITSKNFAIDKDGNTTIAGKISATSGWIGDVYGNGFTITNDKKLKFTVDENLVTAIDESKSVLYFPYQGKYYIANYPQAILEEGQRIKTTDIIIFNVGDGSANLYDANGKHKHQFTPFMVRDSLTDAQINKGIELSKDICEVIDPKYYLGNHQITYDGSLLVDGVAKGSYGVYVGPDGIGLGNGNFYVDNGGNLTTNGGITLNNTSTEGVISTIKLENGEMELYTKSDDGTLLSGVSLQGGNLTLTGGIRLNGTIEWGSSSSPTKVLYAEYTEDDLDAPPDYGESGYQSYDEYDADSTTSWHRTYNSDDDYYASYSYDGGMTWTSAIKIRGKDGISPTLPGYIEDTYIDRARIESPNIIGGTITGGIFHATGIGSTKGETSAYYIWGPDPEDEDADQIKGYISYDMSGTGDKDEAKNRMFVTTVNRTVLKLHSDSNMSISTDNGGTIYINSAEDIKFYAVCDEEDENSPNIFVNDYKLATQDWVLANAGTGGGSLKITFG